MNRCDCCHGYQEPEGTGIFPCECPGTLYGRIKDLEEILLKAEKTIDVLKRALGWDLSYRQGRVNLDNVGGSLCSTFLEDEELRLLKL